MTRRTSTRLPIIVTEGAYSRAAIAAELEGVSLSEYTEAALAVSVPRTMRQHREDTFAAACRNAIETGGITPQRWEWGLDEQQPFVRRQRSASENQAGRPSSRHHQSGRDAEARSNARSGTGAAGAQRRGEDPPFDGAEHHGTAHPLNYTRSPQN